MKQKVFGWSLIALLLQTISSGMSYAQQKVTIDLSTTQPVPAQMLAMAGKAANGDQFAVNNRYFIKNGKPWLPLMGEFHYNRYPEQYWEEELLKMKAAGLSIVATYVFWNEHETSKGIWDWKGRRNLQHFVDLCRKHGLYAWVRIGPWSHGEQLHGGFPDWIQKMPGNRHNDPEYLAESAKLYEQIAKQLKDRYVQQGGAVLGVQLENEYASGDVGHIERLKQMALDVGIRPIYFTVTANSIFDDQKAEVLPLQGAYVYRGWETAGGTRSKDFLYGNDQWILTNAIGKLFYDVSKFPKGLCEQGAGSQMTYANRFIVDPYVAQAHLQNQLGRGMNLIGYYMFQGGTQTPGLKEPGCPESYDFQAPLTEFGYLRHSYRTLKTIHQFVNDFGEELADMEVQRSSNPVQDDLDTTSLRYVVRHKNETGFVFLNNLQPRMHMPDKRVDLAVKIGQNAIQFPVFTLRSNTAPILPFNLQQDGLQFRYIMAQLQTKLERDEDTWLFFQQIEGVKAQGKLADGTSFEWGNKKEVVFNNKSGKRIHLVLLTKAEAENTWKVSRNGTDMVLLTNADVYTRDNKIVLRQFDRPDFNVKVYPAGMRVFNKANLQEGNIRDFDSFSWKLKQADSPSLPKVTDSEQVEVFVPQFNRPDVVDYKLQVNYRGGSAVLQHNDQILTDDLFNGTTWNIGLKRYQGLKTLTIKVQDWQEGTTGVAPDQVRKIKQFGKAIEGLKWVPQYELVL